MVLGCGSRQQRFRDRIANHGGSGWLILRGHDAEAGEQQQHHPKPDALTGLDRGDEEESADEQYAGEAGDVADCQNRGSGKAVGEGAAEEDVGEKREPSEGGKQAEQHDPLALGRGDVYIPSLGEE